MGVPKLGKYYDVERKKEHFSKRFGFKRPLLMPRMRFPALTGAPDMILQSRLV